MNNINSLWAVAHRTAQFVQACLRRFLTTVAVALWAGAGAGAAGAAPPERVVSINLCTDQLAMLLADPGQVVSVSRLATDPLSSSMVEQARAYAANRGGAEQVFLMHPDLVLAGQYTSAETISLLRHNLLCAFHLTHPDKVVHAVEMTAGESMTPPRMEPEAASHSGSASLEGRDGRSVCKLVASSQPG